MSCGKQASCRQRATRLYHSPDNGRNVRDEEACGKKFERPDVDGSRVRVVERSRSTCENEYDVVDCQDDFPSYDDAGKYIWDGTVLISILIALAQLQANALTCAVVQMRS
jgi:hypothetical protein